MTSSQTRPGRDGGRTTRPGEPNRATSAARHPIGGCEAAREPAASPRPGRHTYVGVYGSGPGWGSDQDQLQNNVGFSGGRPASAETDERSKGMKVVGYVRLSKGDANGHSLDGQHDSISRWCKANGHDLVTVVAEVGSARTPHKLRGRRLAIAAIKGGMAEGIVVRDLDRVTRSVIDAADLITDAKRNDWVLLGAVDGLDTSDDEQELSTNVRVAVAQEERRKIARRTREGLAAAKRKRKEAGLPPLGKPRQVKPEVERRIMRMHREGLTPYNIAKWLDAKQVPTPQGGAAWSPSVVRDVIRRNTKGAVA